MIKIPKQIAAAGAMFALALYAQAQPVTNWNAWNDFYFDPAAVNNNGGSWAGNTNVNPAWQYGGGNVNGNAYAPNEIGWFLPPGSYFYAMTAGGPIAGTASYTATGPGTYFAYYTDNAFGGGNWGVQVGKYNYVWETNAPGVFGTTNNTYVWLLDANISGTGSGIEGICGTLQFTCPRAGTYTFTGSFRAGYGSGVDTNQDVDVAICDNTRSNVDLTLPSPPFIPQDLNRTLIHNGSSLPYSFTLTNVPPNTLVQWQAGNNFFSPIPVGVQANVSFDSTPPILLSASRAFLDPTKVIVTFDRSLDTNSAVNPANYSITGQTVTGAKLSPSDETGSTVIINVNPGIDYTSTLTVNGVEESIGQKPIAANSQANIPTAYNVPNGFGTPANAAVPDLSGTTLATNWVATLAVYNPSQSNYYYGNIFVQSNGVIHCHSNNTNQDSSFLAWVDPSYSNVTEEVLEHLTIVNANFDSRAVAGCAVGVQPDSVDSIPEGGNTIRAIPANYSCGPSMPVFLDASDFIADECGNTRYQQWAVGGSYWLRIRQDIDPSAPGTGVIVSSKAWAGDGSEAEPATWDNVYKDSAGLDRTGYGAIRAGWGVGGIMDFDVDYFQVTAPGLPVITPELPPLLLPRIIVNIAVGGGNAIASWPTAAPVKYTLQSSSAINGPWATVTQPVIVNGAANTVTVPISGSIFFRLIQ